MCHVLVKVNEKLQDPEERKEFLKKKRLEISQKMRNAIILFVFTQNKNSKRVIEKYQKRHPKAIHWQD